MKILLLIGGASIFSAAAAASLATIHSMSQDLDVAEFAQPSVPQLDEATPVRAELPAMSAERPVEMPVIHEAPAPAIASGGEGSFAATEHWAEIDQITSLDEGDIASEDESALPAGMSFVPQPEIVAAPPVIRQQTTPRPVESLIPDDRPADDRTVKQTWSVGVYR